MPDSKTNDLFMYFKTEKGDMTGESALQVASAGAGELLMGEFKSADYDNFSNFFDVTDFDFSVELDDSDESGASDSNGPHADWYMHKDPVRAFTIKRDRDGNIQYKLKKISGSFGKTVDSVSPVFFERCCYKIAFPKAVLVKRVFTGARVARDDSSALAYLRLLMEEVKITSISWSDGDVVEEKIKFKCEHMEITYRKQGNDGLLGGKVPLLDWKWTKRGEKRA